MRLEQPSTIANYALMIETNDLPVDFTKIALKRSKRSQPKIYKELPTDFQTNNMRIVIAGKGSEVADKENLTYKGKKVPVRYFDKNAEEVEKPDYNKAVDPNMTAETVFNIYIDAIGGQQAVDQVNSVYMMAEADIQVQKIDLEIKTTSTGQSAHISP